MGDFISILCRTSKRSRTPATEHHGTHTESKTLGHIRAGIHTSFAFFHELLREWKTLNTNADQTNPYKKIPASLKYHDCSHRPDKYPSTIMHAVCIINLSMLMAHYPLWRAHVRKGGDLHHNQFLTTQATLWALQYSLDYPNLDYPKPRLSEWESERPAYDYSWLKQFAHAQKVIEHMSDSNLRMHVRWSSTWLQLQAKASTGAVVRFILSCL